MLPMYDWVHGWPSIAAWSNYSCPYPEWILTFSAVIGCLRRDLVATSLLRLGTLGCVGAQRMCSCPSLWASCLRTQGRRRCGGGKQTNEKLTMMDDAHSWRDAWWLSSPSELPICCFIPNFQKSHIFLFRLCLHFPPQERESVNSPQGLLGSLVQSLQDVAQSLHSIQQHNSPSSSCCVTSLRMVFFRDCYASGVLIFYLDIY